MQRILQPGDIEAIDHTQFPRIRLPEPVSLFTERAARLRQQAEGHPIGEYLRFLARLVQAQAQAAAQVEVAAPEPAVLARAQAHAMPLLPAAEHIPPEWQGVLDQLLAALKDEENPALAPTLQALAAMNFEARNALARRVLLGLLTEDGDLAAAPLVMAALQVVFAVRASHLSVADIPYTDPANICPVCASAPVASVLRIGGAQAGLRYLHCGGCCTEWHMVRVKCSHCEATQGIAYQGIDGAGEAVLAETCSNCHSYRKIANQEKDPFAEPLADDLASLMLDLLMSETEFARASLNPLLPMSEAGAPAPSPASA